MNGNLETHPETPVSPGAESGLPESLPDLRNLSTSVDSATSTLVWCPSYMRWQRNELVLETAQSREGCQAACSVWAPHISEQKDFFSRSWPENSHCWWLLSPGVLRLGWIVKLGENEKSFGFFLKVNVHMCVQTCRAYSLMEPQLRNAELNDLNLYTHIYEYIFTQNFVWKKGIHRLPRVHS